MKSEVHFELNIIGGDALMERLGCVHCKNAIIIVNMLLFYIDYLYWWYGAKSNTGDLRTFNCGSSSL